MTERPGRARRTIAALEADGRILPDIWRDWRFGRDGLFYHPQWRRGFEPDELAAMWFTTTADTRPQGAGAATDGRSGPRQRRSQRGRAPCRLLPQAIDAGISIGNVFESDCRLTVNLAPVSDLNHQHPHGLGLNLADDPVITHAVAP